MKTDELGIGKQLCLGCLNDFIESHKQMEEHVQYIKERISESKTAKDLDFCFKLIDDLWEGPPDV